MPSSPRLQSFSISQSSLSHLAVLLVLGLWLFGLEGGWLSGLDIGGLGLTDRDEGSNAEAAREMLETGEWISPTLNYEPRFAKPAFVYWLISGSYSLFGINEFAARFPSALSGLCVLLLQYAFVYRWLGAP
ncbi:MAG: glycosyltransferase family 39 protein, partial [Nitrospirota bacterium]|nr:glycosyltransferase family 39 protein [Nitrospirota bacterium]